MAKPILDDELWTMVEPVIPAQVASPKGGRPPVSNRAALTGILFVLRTGCPWELLPQEMGCGSGMTCWRRLRDWHQAGVWQKIWQILLDQLGLADKIDWNKFIFDSCSVRAVFGGRRLAPIPPTVKKTARNDMRPPMASCTPLDLVHRRERPRFAASHSAD